MGMIEIGNVLMATWDVGSFLQNLGNVLKTWGSYIVTIIGVIMVIAAAYQIADQLGGNHSFVDHRRCADVYRRMGFAGECCSRWKDHNREHW